MNSIEDIEKVVKAVEGSLKSWVRNDYERRVLTETNLAKLGQVQLALSRYSGDYVTGLRNRVTALERTIVNKEAEFQNPPNNSNAFTIDFTDDGNVDAEIAIAEESLRKQEKAKAEKRKARRGAGGRKVKLLNTADDDDDDEGGEEKVLPKQGNKVEMDVEETNMRVMKTREIARFSKQSSSDIPPEVCHAQGSASGMVFTLEGTAMCAMEFDDPIDLDADHPSCYCRVEMYRCVLGAALYGKPLLSPESLSVSFSAPNAEVKGVATESDDKSDNDVVEEEEEEEDSTVETQRGMNRLGDDLAYLSEQLVQDFEAEEEVDADDSTGLLRFPLKIAKDQCSSWLRTMSSSVWTILLCHGGYFAGGIFHNKQCIVHKAFQRYVVRKKQGGKQSSVGAGFGSIGSQIRAAQEVKWRIDVRDILEEWRSWIDASSIILFAAPGPSNRSILTDFSAVPASGNNGSNNSTMSPVSIKDPRVRKVPITTHRPTFSEVQRIFDEVSTYQIVYVQ